MTNPAAADFFALEAGECLERLESLAVATDGPPADEFLRAARVLRGAALMAGQQPVARAAAGLEGVARAYRDGRRPWDAALFHGYAHHALLHGIATAVSAGVPLFFRSESSLAWNTRGPTRRPIA